MGQYLFIAESLQLLKWIEYPNFNESVVGFFVRVCIGNNRYIIAKIKSQFPLPSLLSSLGVSEYKPSTREIRQTQLPKKNLSKALALDHAGKVKTCPIYQTSSRPFTLVRPRLKKYGLLCFRRNLKHGYGIADVLAAAILFPT